MKALIIGDNQERSKKGKQDNWLFKKSFHLPSPAMISLLVIFSVSSGRDAVILLSLNTSFNRSCLNNVLTFFQIPGAVPITTALFNDGITNRGGDRFCGRYLNFLANANEAISSATICSKCVLS